MTGPRPDAGPPEASLQRPAPRLAPATVATLVALAGIAGGVALALFLVPLLSDLPSATPAWRRWLLAAAAVFVPLLLLWCRRTLRPVRVPTAPEAERRRAAHDFPFRAARLCFAAALGSGVATGAGLWSAHPGQPAGALSAGVVTYLVLVLPILGVYLGARRALHRVAAGPPGAGPVRGIRQSIGLRLSLAVQLPVVVCMAGLVMVEQYNDIAYGRDLARFYQEQYTQALSRVVLALDDPADRRAALAALHPPPGIEPRSWSVPGTDAVSYGLVVDPDVERPLHQRLPPFLLLVGVTLLGALLGRWLARDVTTELATVARTLRTLREGRPEADGAGRPPAAVALREVGALLVALDEALAAYRDRQTTIRQAAEARRRAEQAKSRFLAHLSHELKSPLNSILGFSEVLLSGLDGDLTPDQRDKLAIIWRSGDMLLRYILALLDLARLDAGPDGAGPGGPGVDARLLGFEPAPVTAADLARAIRQQWRKDPLDQLRLDLRVEVDDPEAIACSVDRMRTARAVILAAGMLLDAVERGTATIAGRPAPAGLEVEVSLHDADGHDADRRHLVEQLAAAETAAPDARPAHIGAAATVAMLLHRVATAQGGRLTVHLTDPWPRLVFTLPSA